MLADISNVDAIYIVCGLSEYLDKWALRISASRSRDWLQLLRSALNWILIMGTVSSSSVTGKEIL